jgi:uncharacterized protein (DUF169 family)
MSQSSLAALLGLDTPPVAITFVDTPPAGVPRVAASEPAGCGYWRRAAAGEVFFTLADDHKRCPVGAHTHHVSLTLTEQAELMGLVKTMVDLSYLKIEEVAKIARRQTPLQAAVYSPLALAPIPPDVVLVRGNARQLMLLAEAAEHAGVNAVSPAIGRPTCAVVPESINAARTAVSFGCVGNRVYTGAGDTEAYFAIPGSQLAAVEESLATIVRANQALEHFHRARAASAGPIT